MNAVGIDVSKGKSMIAVMRPFGEVVRSPFEVHHTDSELSELARRLKSVDGETRVVMEYTGNYHAPIAWALHDAGLYVSVVNPMLVHGYGNNSLRQAKTDKKDAIKLSNYAIDRWLSLPQYFPEEDTRMMLKNCYRQYEHYSKLRTSLKNNLISLLDQAFPDVHKLFSSPRRADGSEKWLDFIAAFWHCECVSRLSQDAFTRRYQRWCRKHGYNFSEQKAEGIYFESAGHISVMPIAGDVEIGVIHPVNNNAIPVFCVYRGWRQDIQNGRRARLQFRNVRRRIRKKQPLEKRLLLFCLL